MRRARSRYRKTYGGEEDAEDIEEVSDGDYFGISDATGRNPPMSLRELRCDVVSDYFLRTLDFLVIGAVRGFQS